MIWMDRRMDGWVDVEADLWIAYNNQKNSDSTQVTKSKSDPALKCKQKIFFSGPCLAMPGK